MIWKQRAQDVHESLPAHTPVAELAETLVAMANSQGGLLWLELGNVPAEEAIDHIREASLCADPALILPLPAVVDDKPRGHVVIVSVPRGLPHVFSLNGRYLAREGGVNRALSARELRRLLIERGDLNYEEEIVQDASLDDLDWRKVDDYVRRLKSTKRGESARDMLAPSWTPRRRLSSRNISAR